MPKIKLLPEHRQEIVRLYLAGQGTVRIGERFSVSSSAINNALRKAGVTIRDINARRAYPVNHDFFETIDTEEKAYWLGFIATDGNIYKNRLTINLSDREHLEKIAKAIGCPRPIRPIKTTINSKSYELWSFYVNSAKIAADLSRIGITNKKTFEVHPWVGPSHLMRHYWRGCVDGDGWVRSHSHYDTRFRIGMCGNLQMVTGFVDFAEHVTGFRATIFPNKKIFYSEYTATEEVRALASTLYANCSVSLDRKHDVATRAICAPPPKRHGWRPQGPVSLPRTATPPAPAVLSGGSVDAPSATSTPPHGPDRGSEP